MAQDFQELTTQHLSAYYSFTNRYMSFSDINFTSLISWSPKILFQLDDDSLFLCFEDYSSDSMILSGLSSRQDDFINSLISLHETIPHSIIDALPSTVIEGLQDEDLRKRFQLAQNQSDYLYKPSSHIQLDGHKFLWHRRKLSVFHRSASDCQTDVFRSMDSQDMETFSKIWMTWKEVANPKEVGAIKRYVNNFNALINQYIFKVLISGELQGFAFCELIEGPTRDFLIHFFKTNKAFEGLSNYLFVEIAKFAATLNADYVNFEQDLDEPGLRYYKQHLRPDKMLEKYFYSSN